MSAYSISGGEIHTSSGPLIRGLDLTFKDHAVTAIVGPGGVGKTSLLRALSGEKLQDGLVLRGDYRLRGVPRSRWSALDITYVPQQRAKDESFSQVRAQLERNTSVLLLDEPCDDGRTLEAQALLRGGLLAQRKRGTALIVTHNLDLIRGAADQVCLLCAGRVDTLTDTQTFFENPPTELSAQFVRQGNCWPRVALPKHFHWVRDGLAGMGRPGLLGNVEDDLAAIASQGVDLLVTLTERRFPMDLLKAHGITGKHFPIADMGVPAINATASLCRDVARARDNGSRVAFHCEAGLGRTGTMLASFLTWTGASAQNAIDEVRAVIRGAIQTESQAAFVRRFAEAFGGST